MSILGKCSVALFLCGSPVYAQVYGPDGEELPPVPETPPTQPGPQTTPSEDSPLTWRLNSFPGKSRRFRATAGGFFPIGRLSTVSGGNVWPVLSFAYDVRQQTPRNPLSVTAFLEGMAVARPFRNEFREMMEEVYEMYGLGVETRLYMRPSSSVSVYIGGGAGSYYLRRGERFNNDQSPFVLFNDDALVRSDYYVRPGVKFLFGLEEKHGFYAEFRYQDAGALRGVRFAGISAALGARF